MKNGFNHRRITSIIMFIFALVLVISNYGCRSTKTLINKSNLNTERSEVKINTIDSTVTLKKNVITKKVDSLFWSNSEKYFDLSYTGIDKEDYLEVSKTNNGIKFLGKGQINIKTSQSKSDSIKKSNQSNNIQNYSKVEINSKTETHSKENYIKNEKSKEKFSIGPTFIVGSIIFILLIILIIYKKFKKND